MMKISKLLKVGAFALLAASLCFVGCKKEEDDDVKEMISGSNNNYSINYNNSTSDTSRGYKTTTFQHLGALCQITMHNDSAAGAMGYIWDLESNSSRASTDPRRFFIVGFNYDYTASGKVAYYLSMYKNITDIDAKNFGATTTATGTNPLEKEYIKLDKDNSFTPTPDSDGNFTVTVNVREGTFTSDGTWASSSKSYKSGDYNGTYIVDIYNGAYTEDNLPATPAKTYTIPMEDVGYVTTANNTTTVTSKSNRQKNGAVYANVYQGKTLKGSWRYVKTYSNDEVVEE